MLGASGFVGSALLPALVSSGHAVRAATRDLDRAERLDGVTWVTCDVNERADVARAMAGVDAVFFLVHAMGNGVHDYADQERRAAEVVRHAAAAAGVLRIVYLGGVAPTDAPSEHLKSRLAVGEVLRGGKVPTVELRASMIVGRGSASWQIVRDLAMRLPAMILPKWTASRTRPVALQDVVVALVCGLTVPLPGGKSAWFDIPGPDVVSGRDILRTLAALRGRRVPSINMPFLSVSLSSWWLKLVTRADFSLARELVLGFKGDLLPRDALYWDHIHYHPRWTFEAAAREALSDDNADASGPARLEEALVQLVSPKLSRDPQPPGP